MRGYFFKMPKPTRIKDRFEFKLSIIGLLMGFCVTYVLLSHKTGDLIVDVFQFIICMFWIMYFSSRILENIRRGDELRGIPPHLRDKP